MSRWTETQDKILTRCWNAGLSAREISEQLEGKAIIAVRRRAERLGLKQPTTATQARGNSQ